MSDSAEIRVMVRFLFHTLKQFYNFYLTNFQESKINDSKVAIVFQPDIAAI
jgi:hypothetical protein